MKNLIVKPTEFVQYIVSQYIKEGDLVVDATLGGGYDTIFLSKQVKAKGKVYAFDIQKEAIDLSRKKIKLACEDVSNIELIQDGHQNMNVYIKEEVAAIMFNLGYLPSGNREITTKEKTTLIALETALGLLKKNGILSIVVYPGHAEGANEKDSVLDYAAALDARLYHVYKMDMINQPAKRAPIMVMITRK